MKGKLSSRLILLQACDAPQGDFLRALGVEFRVAALLRSLTVKHGDGGGKAAEDVYLGFKRLTGTTEDGGMGETYKVLAMEAPVRGMGATPKEPMPGFAR